MSYSRHFAISFWPTIVIFYFIFYYSIALCSLFFICFRFEFGSKKKKKSENQRIKDGKIQSNGIKMHYDVRIPNFELFSFGLQVALFRNRLCIKRCSLLSMFEYQVLTVKMYRINTKWAKEKKNHGDQVDDFGMKRACMEKWNAIQNSDFNKISHF